MPTFDTVSAVAIRFKHMAARRWPPTRPRREPPGDTGGRGDRPGVRATDRRRFGIRLRAAGHGCFRPLPRVIEDAGRPIAAAAPRAPQPAHRRPFERWSPAAPASRRPPEPRSPAGLASRRYPEPRLPDSLASRRPPEPRIPLALPRLPPRPGPPPHGDHRAPRHTSAGPARLPNRSFAMRRPAAPAHPLPAPRFANAARATPPRGRSGRGGIATRPSARSAAHHRRARGGPIWAKVAVVVDPGRFRGGNFGNGPAGGGNQAGERTHAM